MLIRTFVPVGTVLPYAGPLATGDGSAAAIRQIKTNLWTAGWLYCDGAAMSCNDYRDLFGVIGYAFGGSDGSFNLPDLRGQFIRGVSDNATQDPDRADRKPAAPGGNAGAMVGSVQQD
ncbi:MAG TPA: phage tail protein, partial [Paucimonas sp.]|nr:phage tail protein [Paucimonas sp.]